MSEQTAYGQSIAVAQALMATAKERMTDLERMEQETANAKKAFRSAFDYWTEMQPVVNTVDYWTVAINKANSRFNDSNQDPLTQRLLTAVLEYLEFRATSETHDA